jgi:hypothetical protein
MGDYEQCPFCERIFAAPTRIYDSGDLDRHIRTDHHKVKLRKGTNYKWVDAAEMEKLVRRTQK